jgi:hypothetical protein
VYIANHFQLASNGRAMVVADVDVPTLLAEAAATKPNLVLIGGPKDNTITRTILERGTHETLHPQHPHAHVEVINGSHVRIGPCHFHGTGYGVAAMVPVNADQVTTTSTAPQLALILAGVDGEGLAAVVELATPTIPPMVRSPFSNTLPDYIVTSPMVRSSGAAGIVAAGYWGNSWEWRNDVSYTAFCHSAGVGVGASDGGNSADGARDEL